MKVVHIATSIKGGAGIAALRIHLALLKSGIDSTFISIDKIEDIEKRIYSLQQKKENLPTKIGKKIAWRLKTHFKIHVNSKESLYSKLNRIKGNINAEMISMPFSEYDILQDERVKNADLIHLHWVSGMLDYPSFFKNCSKQIVWTMHDMNPILGLYHYSRDEDRNHTISGRLNEYVLSIKKKSLLNAKMPVFFVAPSAWLLTEAISTGVDKEKAVQIFYPIDKELFFRSIGVEVKNQLNIPHMNTVIVFVAERLSNYRKGFDLLLEAIGLLNNKERITIFAIGESSDIQVKGLDIRMVGKLTDEKSMRQYYSLADIFVLPSREDNLPDVMIESMSCGTPVVAFKEGGMKEVILTGFNGVLAENINGESLASAIEEAISCGKNFNAKDIEDFAEKTFSETHIGKSYTQVYNSLLSKD